MKLIVDERDGTISLYLSVCSSKETFSSLLKNVAAISLARRVSDERNSTVGKSVGYTVRFDDCSSTSTNIKYMTDGILVREALRG